MRVSVIATVLNEGESIRRLLESLAAQSRVPDEIVIVDGGSTDRTAAIIESYADRLPILLRIEHGANISRGRNLAIAAASGDVIAATDAGVRLTDRWLEHLTAPFDGDAAVQCVAGFFLPDVHTVFEAAMGATVLPQRADIDPSTFLPSSRSVAFTKSAWERVGGYPEWLDYCEDLVFDFRMRDIAGPFAFAPDALVYFRPRTSLRAFYKQYRLYARGDGKADLWRKRHAIRYATYVVGAPLIAAAGFVVHPIAWGLFAVGALAYCRRPWSRLPAVLRGLPYAGTLDMLKAALWVPVIRVVGDIAKMIGYPAGVLWRIRNRPPDWRRA
ncbi:MAG: glycosyltransferase [Chloroflexi bacterium]|nr:glycosyltransferase [Chloroflexota bacterium]